MSGTDTAGWRRTSPLAAVFYLGKIYEAIAKNAVQSLAPLAAFLVAFQGDRLAAAIVGIGLFFAATVLHAFLRYWFFRYRLASDSIYIRDGVFRKRQLDIKFDRVQGINTTQNVIFRLFGLVTLNLDTAGASGQEGHLPAVGRALAEGIRERIRRTPRRDLVPAGEAEPSVARPEAEMLLRLKLGDVVRVGLSSGRVFLVLLLIGPLLDYFEDRLQAIAEEEALLELLGAAQPTFATALALALTVAIVIFVVLMAASVIGAVLRWHGYELTVDADVLRAHGGLLTRQEQSVHRAKVQSLYVIQNFMLRRFRRYRLRTRQATSGRAVAASRFDVPICAAEVLPRIGLVLFRDELGELPLTPQAPGFAPISRAYVRARTVTHGVVPALCACALLGPAFGFAALLMLLWIPLSTGIALRQHRRFGVAVTRDGMAFRRGFVGFRIVVWLHRKVQRVSVTQSPFQRRRGLATMKFFLAAGSVTVPFVEYASAARLRDYVLYCVESSERAWH